MSSDGPVRDLAETTRFAAVAAHQLREPLRTISGFLGLLEHRYGAELDPRAAELVAHALAGARRMDALIDDMLDWSEIGAVPARRDAVDLDAVLTGVLGDLRARIDATGAEVEVGPLPGVRGDGAQLAQALLNLIANALTFVAPGTIPRVQISAAVTEDRPGTAISVSDNGIGIDEAHRPAVFGLFTRLHTTAAYEGTGIGLSVVARVASNHGGDVTITQSPAGGASFTFWLPA